MSNSTETILAPASALGGGVAVIRVSGRLASKAFSVLVGTENPQPKLMYLAEFKNLSGRALDKGLAVFFANPHSFTGEDVAEFHIHGGRAVAERVIRALLAIDPSMRLAEGGEFSKRAYLNGKLDLTEAEAIADLVAAETEIQAELAIAQMNGALRHLYEGWRAQLVHLLALMEAAIDFVDEEDVPVDLLRDTDEKITALFDDIIAHLDDNNLGERLRDGFTIAVIGAPNAGKSSLVNALVKRDVAIVSSIAGTTRDMIEAHVNLGGYPAILIDTAGLRDTDNEIEQIGIARAKTRAASADLILALFDATQSQDDDTLAQINDRTVVVHTKSDLISDVKSGLYVSVTTGHGMDHLVQLLTTKIATLASRKTNTPLLTRTRHRDILQVVCNDLQRALQNAEPELKTEDIRLATRGLGKLTGRVDVEDLLDVIFRDFCIGK